MQGAARRSSHSGKDTGGQLVHMRNFECVQTTAVPRPKHLHNLDAATEGDRVNPMAPSQPPPTPQAIPNKSQLKPQPKIKTGGLATAPDLSLPSNIQPSFSMVALNQQFGFKLPIVGEVNSNVNHGSQHDEDHRQSTTLEDPSLQLEEPTNLPSLHCEELNNPAFPLSCPIGLWHTASFYDTPFNGVRLHGHTLFATPAEDKDHDPAGEGNYSDTPIDETTPSEDNHFAESVLWGDNAHMHMQSQAHLLSYTEYSGQGECSSDTNSKYNHIQDM
ncbi:hypothetical protein EDC04DRAFT_2790289 [Pisolithus marmoratus]|nr:hypothetical protein EDC04DRAFT_2790289 [Pisolithus marmoratus]